MNIFVFILFVGACLVVYATIGCVVAYAIKDEDEEFFDDPLPLFAGILWPIVGLGLIVAALGWVVLFLPRRVGEWSRPRIRNLFGV